MEHNRCCCDFLGRLQEEIKRGTVRVSGWILAGNGGKDRPEMSENRRGHVDYGCRGVLRKIEIYLLLFQYVGF